MKLVIAHTPDPDDSFMFYAMFEKKIPCAFEYDQVVKDIETLNKEAPEELYDVTAISANGYAKVHDKYYLTTSGASFGLSYGPAVVAKKEVDLSKSVVAVPGKFTSAYLLYKMFAPEPKEFREVRFDQIPEAVLSGEVDAGILIHDEQLTFQNKGLIKVLDLYEKWKQYAGDLPIPLGFNAIKKSVGKDVAMKYKKDFEDSIKYSMNNEDAAVKYSLKYARYADMELERKFIRMYVNPLSIDFGEKGRKALDLYYKRAVSMNLIEPFNLEII
ncbi:MAG: ABC transporter substrate-binding protein [Candidatus Thermoplasmatota archaeon]|jgi:1,4-dihydroxy-6-naphthoate synthase|nr:ABC transporter substrate-binding protein [Candidatus Thermoplasmatota archaeon]